MKKILINFRLDFYGVHGFPHWCRIIDNGLYLSKFYDIDMDIIISFVFFHDIERVFDEYDYQHGVRGGKFFMENKSLLSITDKQAAIIFEASCGHTDIHHSDNLNIVACWDSDRHDLMRVGIQPQSPFLNLKKSKEIDFILDRSNPAKSNSIPNWGFELLFEL